MRSETSSAARTDVAVFSIDGRCDRDRLWAECRRTRSAANAILTGCEIFVDMAGLIDVAAEVQRITKELEKVQAGIKGKESKLNNEGFVARAPANVVTLEREQLAELQARATSLTQVLADLKKMG